MCIINTNPPFLKNSAVVVSEIDNVKNFALITTAIKKHDFKSEYLFRMCSVTTHLVTSQELRSHLWYYAVPSVANYGTVPYSFNFIPILAPLQAVLEKNGTVPERLGRNEEQDCINFSKRCAVKPDVHFSIKKELFPIFH